MTWISYLILLTLAVLCHGQRRWKIREYKLEATSVKKSIVPPGYPKYRKMAEYDWYITAPPGKNVQMTIDHLYIEKSDGCQYDYLDIFDSATKSNKKRIARLCGSIETETVYTSSQTDAVLSFYSDETITDYGFLIYYVAVEIVNPIKTTPTLTTIRTTTTSKAATTTTTAKTTTTYATTTKPSTTIPTISTIATTIFDTATSPQQTTTTTARATSDNYFTTTLQPVMVTTSLRRPTTNDVSTTSLASTTSAKTTTSVATTTNKLTGILNGRELPKCQDYYTNHYILIATSEKQYFTSHGYPNSYTRNSKEEWLIVKPNATAPLAIVVKDTDIEKSSGCGYDRVVVYDHACPYSTSIGVFCGSDLPSYNLNGGQFALVRFSVDTSNHGRGIKIEYYIGVAPKSKDDNHNEDQLRDILLGIIIAIVILSFIVGIIRCVHRFKRRKEMQKKHERQRMNMAALTSTSQEPVTCIREIVAARSSTGSRGRTVTIHSVSPGTDFQGGSTHSGTRDSTSLPFTDLMVHPPSYSAMFSTSQFNNHLPQPNEDKPQKLPLYDEPSCNPPPYSAGGGNSGKLQGTRPPRRRSTSEDRPPPVYSAHVINVAPPTDVRDIISPPPAYEDSLERRDRARRTQRRSRRIIQ